MKGVPLRVEIGPKDMEKQQCCIARRDTGEKVFVPLTDLETYRAGPAEGGTRQPLRHGREEPGGQHLRLHHLGGSEGDGPGQGRFARTSGAAAWSASWP